jgi:acyl carrier protein
LGFLEDGELFITGRLKDVIIIRGRNHYPEDIELTVEQSHPALRSGCCAAFSIDKAGDEQLVVVQEVERHYRKLHIDGIVRAIRRAVSKEHELQVYAVALLKPGSLPKTSSGKNQRRVCRARFLANELDIIGSSILQGSETICGEEGLTRTSLLALDPEERQPLLESYFRAQVARVLKVVPSQLELQQPLSTLGLDSLMAFELKNKVEVDLEVSIPMVNFLRDFSITQLVAQLPAYLSKPSNSCMTANASNNWEEGEL